MQPTYLPWLGYFALIDAVDTFVFLDSVQFDRRSWQQRNQIKNVDAPMWLTIPVQGKGRYAEEISKILIDRSSKFQRKHIGSIKQVYKKAPFFEQYGESVLNVLSKPYENLADLTVDLIETLSGMLGIKVNFLRSSNLSVTGSKADLLAEICEAVNATEYISPTGAACYLQQSDAFSARGIKVLYNDYQHPEYKQLKMPFMPFMSVLDLLFNEGPNSLKIIRSGAKLVSASEVELQLQSAEILNGTT